MNSIIRKIDVNISVLLFLKRYRAFNPTITYIKDINKVKIKITLDSNDLILMDGFLTKQINKEIASLENYLSHNIEFLPNDKMFINGHSNNHYVLKNI